VAREEAGSPFTCYLRDTRKARTLVTFAASVSLPASTSGLLESPPSGSLRECRGTTLALPSLKERGKRPLDATSP